MGIRTVGFEKVARAPTREEKRPNEVKTSLEKATTKGEKGSTSKSSDGCQKAEPVNEKSHLEPATSTRVAENGRLTGSPLKLRIPASMARLEGIKAAARKLKKQRKRRLFARSTNKILRNSIKSNKTRRSYRVEESSRETRQIRAIPSRISTRMCVRRGSREGIPEAPLRTVELIKRPLELREPATKLLYMASLGLYPYTGESDMTPIVVIKELAASPGKKNGVRKSLELPLILFHKRILDFAEKRSSLVNAKPVARQENRRAPPIPTAEKQENRKTLSVCPGENRKTSPVSITVKPDSRKTPPISIPEKLEVKKEKSEMRRNEPKQAPVLKPSPTSVAQINITEAISHVVANDYTKATIESSKKSPSSLNGVVKSLDKSLDLTITTGKVATAPSLALDTSKVYSNSKSLLKTNQTLPAQTFTSGKRDFVLPPGINLVHNVSTPNLPEKTASAYNVTKAMNYIMSNITILPTPVSADMSSRKRRSNANLPIVNGINPSQFLTAGRHASSSINGVGQIPVDEKPPRKKQRCMQEAKSSRLSLPVSTVKVGKTSPVQCQNSSLPLVQPMLTQQTDEALNLCVKRNSEVPVALVKSPPPKLQNKTSVKIKGNVTGPRPLNLIIPRPPPLTKAPLELTNIANASLSQNVQPLQSMKAKSHAKKAKKSKPNHNQRHQSGMQLPLLPPLTSNLAMPAEATVHSSAKSLLKCMNVGEENSCARQVGETLDSVKTMLARLQTSIGPAVNGVQLITIE